MSLLLANLISVAVITTGLIVFFVTLRKANKLTAMSRALAQQVAGSAKSLEQALQLLQNERETCRDESVRLEAKLKDSDRARTEMTRTIHLVERARNEFKDNVRPFPAIDPAQRNAAPASVAQPAAAAPPAVPVQPAAPAKVLPVFVNRIVRSADVASVVL
ncbi:hypothetical protein HB779_01270 (plasmid) [Phyllobacterium sp. 628]|uniref:BAB2_0123 family type IV secretion system effector n=1 Tax=Phyllobacterium sp. 628 TaxID=2718938 RepID=UPI0016623BC6|nr:hypothetical protein [Phyllobacterium sp. 628]QND50632.1 hypothetical protein HB779_01270 [Phyllobacterium sp. 628]